MSHGDHIKQLTIYNLTAKSISYNNQGMPTIWPGKVNLSGADKQFSVMSYLALIFSYLWKN
jgi:hypothetical protein